MPSEQRGSVYTTATAGHGIRWIDETGQRRRQAGFSSPSKARAWFRDVELPRMRGGLVNEPLTLREFSERYIARYEADRSPVTVATLKARLVRPLAEFGGVNLADLRTGELAAWEATLPPRFRYAVVRALRQVLDAAVAWEYLSRNPAKATGRNHAPVVVERIALEPSDVDKLAGEMRTPYDVALVVGAWCYLRPSELLALERGDVDGNVLHIKRTLDGQGGTKASAKTRRSLRTVPLPLRARQALAELPPRLDTRLLFPAPSGAPWDICNFRRREFKWAREAAGLDEAVTPYTLRHSGISWALAAGIPSSDVARFAGTSVTMLETTYHHLLETSADAARQRLDAFAERSGQEVATK
ncbi:MAG: site-specific integrase [Actinobacteria bacterium]|nr:site-specific integrase [Actinomycetota bacterium]